MIAGDAAMVVALADSFFFDVDPNGARSRVLAFLLVSFAPFLVVAPMIGPAIDRMPGGRRLVVRVMAIVRIALAILMALNANSFVLFPLVFVALVSPKSYAIAKSSLVPSVVTSEQELVEANSKLGLIAGVAGAIAVAPAGIIQVALGTPATLVYSGVCFAVALVASLQLPQESQSDKAADDGGDQRDSPAIDMGWVAMFTLRAAAGFMLFHLAFWYRGMPGEKRLLAIAVGVSSLATMMGNAAAPKIRQRLAEEKMLLVALALPAIAGLAATVVGGVRIGIVVAASVNVAAAIGRLSFESLLQRDGSATDRGRAFARFELRFQLGWVGAAVLPVLVDIPGLIGLGLVGAVFTAAVINYARGLRRSAQPSFG